MIAQTLMTYAFRIASASKISIYGFANIVFSILFFNKIPDYLSIIGASIIISAAYLNYYKNKIN